jgi:hypothetical protein
VGVYPIGNQRVGIERETVTGYGDYGEPITEPVIVWVDKACFEIQTPSEQQNLTVTTSEIAWAMLPLADGAVPAVDDDDDPAPVQFFDTDGKPTISASLWLHHNGLRYAMRGDAVLEQDIRGRQDHVFCVCEREQG